MIKPVCSITELNQNIKNIVENNNALKNVTVLGEISDYKLHNSGHIYLTLKDETSSIKATVWKTNADKLKALNPYDGMKIQAIGNISHYVPYCQLSFNIYDVIVDGEGEAKQIFQERFKEYEARGWFDAKWKKPINPCPKRIGIITAQEGDAVHDIITNIQKRFKSVQLFLFPALVQGIGSAENIAKQIRHANQFVETLDTIILGRGGGSYEHLSAFNEPIVLDAIHESKIPIITGIGHDKDETLAEYVADVKASTPTGAGIAAVAETKNIIEMLNSFYESFAFSLKNIATQSETKLKMLSQNLVNNLKIKAINEKNKMQQTIKSFYSSMSDRVHLEKNKVRQYFIENKNLLQMNLTKTKQTLEMFEQIINLHDVNQNLKKGYSILKNETGVITSVGQLQVGKTISAKLSDGIATLNVATITEEK